MPRFLARVEGYFAFEAEDIDDSHDTAFNAVADGTWQAMAVDTIKLSVREFKPQDKWNYDNPFGDVDG